VTQAVRIAQFVAKLAEFLGAAAATVLAIIAKGNLQTADGKTAVIFAVIAALGHAVSHTSEGATP
jgi:hypothetical protein